MILMVSSAIWSEFITVSQTVAVVLYCCMKFAVMFIIFALLLRQFALLSLYLPNCVYTTVCIIVYILFEIIVILSITHSQDSANSTPLYRNA